MSQKIIQQGAEAIIIRDGNEIIKRRVKKSYRIPEIDERIRRQRTRSEARLLQKASEVISVPKTEKVDDKKMEINMEFIEAKKLSEELNSFSLKEQKKICVQIGESIAKLHDRDIIHGDLTTSNIILKENRIYLIDFGLAFSSHRLEDKAVDLHLIKQALEAKHFENLEALFEAVKKGYSFSKDSKKVLEQLEKVEKRGRYKH